MNNAHTSEEDKPADPSIIKAAEEDGRNIEWGDRARVNVESPGKKSTNVERDFEPEQEEEKNKNNDPAY